MKKAYVWSFIALVALYALLALSLPPDPETLVKYNITAAQARLLSLTIVVPVVAIYFAAFYGAFRFKQYSEIIKGTTEGRPYSQLSNGLLVLAFSLPIISIFASTLAYVEVRNPSSVPAATIFMNYLRLAFPLVAFTLIARGAEGLIATIKTKKSSDHPQLSILGTVALSSVFTWLVINRPITENAREMPYHLSNWLIITTLVIPYLFIWCRGLRAMYHLNKYREKVKGKVYRQALGSLAKGIGAVIVIGILMQMLTTISVRLSRLNLTPLLLMLYVLIMLYAVGYIWVARGANKLKRFEEV